MVKQYVNQSRYIYIVSNGKIPAWRFHEFGANHTTMWSHLSVKVVGKCELNGGHSFDTRPGLGYKQVYNIL